MLRAALIQMTSGDDPSRNLAQARDMLAEAAARGATLALTPEVTNCISADRAHQRATLVSEERDETLRGLREAAVEHGMWLLIGSLGLHPEDGERFANRSFLVSPDGEVVARYDKIHMFDVDISVGESYRESAAYRPGARAVVARTPIGAIGMTVCYDVRFPALYRALAQAGAQILTVPSAFNPTTGGAHWEVLLRARAIETGCFVLAPAQCGLHPARGGATWRSHGHSLAVAPWGEVLADGGTDPGVVVVDLDLSEVDRARARVPSLAHDRAYGAP